MWVVAINEFLADVPGTDDGNEWVELYNGSEESVALDGWALETGTTALSPRVQFADVTIEPWSTLLIGGERVVGADVLAPSLTLGNAGSSADAVRLLGPAGEVVDTVVYGSPNSDAFADDRDAIAVATAPAPAEGLSLYRSPNGADTDDASVDFRLGSPTPGAANPAPIVCGEVGRVLVNEILPDPRGIDDDSEWVELVNAGEQPVDLSGWTLSFATRPPYEPDVELPAGTTLAAGAFLLIGGEQTDATVITGISPGNGTETDAVRLASCDRTYTDTVLYGEDPNGDGLTDDRGVIADPYGAPDSDQSLARWVDGSDTDTSLDWRVLVVPTPGAPNPLLIPSDDEPVDLPAGCGERPASGCRERPGLAVLLVVLLRRHLLASATSSARGTSRRWPMRRRLAVK